MFYDLITAGTPFSGVSSSKRSEQGVVSVVNAAVIDPSSPISGIVTSLSNLDSSALPVAVTQLLPTGVGSNALSIFNSQQSNWDLVDKLNSRSKNLWITPYANKGQQKSVDGVSSYTDNYAGVLLGGNLYSDDSFNLGTFGGIAKGSLNSGINGSVSSTQYQGGVYGGYQLGIVALKAQVDLTSIGNQGSRSVGFLSENLTSGYTSVAKHAGVSASFAVISSESLSLAPAVGIDYFTLDTPKYGESSGSAALTVDPSNYSQIVTTAKVNASRQIFDNTKIYVDGGISINSNNPSVTQSASFQNGGGKFSVIGMSSGRSSYFGAIGGLISINKNFSASISGSARIANNGYSSLSASAALKHLF